MEEGGGKGWLQLWMEEERGGRICYVFYFYCFCVFVRCT